MIFKKAIKNRWSREGGYREVLKLAFPLILSTGSWSIQHFVDRMFLTWYSPQAIAAATPAGILNFTFVCLFIGTATYVNTFVAQYHGAQRHHRIGPAVWQGLYFALLAGIVVLGLIPLAGPIFGLAGHQPAVRKLEVQYFRILCLGAAPVVAGSAVSGFFSGRGKTWTVMWVNFIATGVNIILDYALIFGHWGFPAWGIRGAAWATVASGCVSAAIFLGIMLRPRYRDRFATLKGWKPEKELFRRLLRFGFPNGVQFMLDMLGFALFIILVGRFGTVPLAATNIAFNINTLAFMPMIGCGMAVSILVGQRLGRGQPKLAARSTWSAFHLTIVYTTVFAFAYLLLPRLFILPFGAQANPEGFVAINHVVRVLLRFVALYCLFDTMNIIMAAAVKGAGDTRFVMTVSVLLSWTVMVIPSYLASIIFHWGLYAVWGFATAYISLLGIIFLLRFLGGKWQTMRVIEEIPRPIATALPEAPASEVEL